MAKPSAIMLLLLAPILCEAFGSFSDTAESSAASQNNPSGTVGAPISGGSSGLSEYEVTKLRRLLQDADERAAQQAKSTTALIDEHAVTFSCAYTDVTVSRALCKTKHDGTRVCTDLGFVVYWMAYIKGALNCYILQFFLLSNGVFWLGFAMVLQFHIRWRMSAVIVRIPFLKKMGLHIARNRLRTIGMSLIILNLWFNPGWVYMGSSRQCFSWSVFFLVLDSYIVFYAADFLLNKASASCPPPTKDGEHEGIPKQNKEGSGDGHNGFMLPMSEVVDPTDDSQDISYKAVRDSAVNMYMDITVKFGNVVALFALQVILVSMYAENMMQGGDDGSLMEASSIKHIDEIDLVKWIAGVMLGMLSGDAQMGADFNWRYWEKLFGKFGNEQKQVVFTWWMRCVMDFFINGFGRLIIMNTFPIMLCVESPLDFVKDCTAVLFITQLDDLDTPKPFKALGVLLKFAVRWRSKQPEGRVGLTESFLPGQPTELTAEELAYANDEDNEEFFKMAQMWGGDEWLQLMSDSKGTQDPSELEKLQKAQLASVGL